MAVDGPSLKAFPSNFVEQFFIFADQYRTVLDILFNLNFDIVGLCDIVGRLNFFLFLQFFVIAPQQIVFYFELKQNFHMFVLGSEYFLYYFAYVASPINFL